MRRAQFSARIGGECAKNSVFDVVNWTDRKSTMAVTETKATGASVRGMLLFDESLASGGVDGTVLLCDVLQQLMFAQQAGLHVFALGAFERMQVRADAGNGAEKMARPSSSESVILAYIAR